MGFLEKFTSLKREKMPSQQAVQSSFDRLTNEELDTHLNIQRYGKFMLTDAIRPSYDLQVVPQPGYRFDSYHDACSGTDVPVLMGALARPIYGSTGSTGNGCEGSVGNQPRITGWSAC